MIVEPRFNNAMQGVFDYFYELEESDRRFLRWVGTSGKIVMSVVDLMYARAGYLFSDPDTQVYHDFHAWYGGMCWEIITFYE